LSKDFLSLICYYDKGIFSFFFKIKKWAGMKRIFGDDPLIIVAMRIIYVCAVIVLFRFLVKTYCGWMTWPRC
jgi:hypothetical protein